MEIRRAETFRARLVGLALRRTPPPWGLHLPATRSVHTFGMRFALDLVWLDAAGRPLRVDRRVPPGRVRVCRRARGGVIELPAASGKRPPARRPPAGGGAARAT